MTIPKNLLDGIDRLDPLPLTVQKLVPMLSKENIKIDEVVGVVEMDFAIAANIMRSANSARYGGRFQIEKLRDAVVRLGTAALLEIALGTHLKSMKFSAPLYDLAEDELWMHGAVSSLAVKAMMQERKNGHIPQISIIAALVHDIGKLIMVRYLESDVKILLKYCEENQATFVEAELALFGCDHAEVGGEMARKWGFPTEVRRAIEEHHRMPIANPDPTLDAVMLANLAAKSAGVGLGAEGLNMRIDFAGCRERLGLSLEGFERVIAQTAIWARDLKVNYGARS
jgi:putative nucleotidyltransferase with HDIG domain